jgi:hypothetical protein
LQLICFQQVTETNKNIDKPTIIHKEKMATVWRIKAMEGGLEQRSIATHINPNLGE